MIDNDGRKSENGLQFFVQNVYMFLCKIFGNCQNCIYICIAQTNKRNRVVSFTVVLYIFSRLFPLASKLREHRNSVSYCGVCANYVLLGFDAFFCKKALDATKTDFILNKLSQNSYFLEEDLDINSAFRHNGTLPRREYFRHRKCKFISFPYRSS